MKKIRILIFSIVCLLILPLHGFSQFTLSGELRPRLEYRHGFQSLSLPEDDPAFFTSQRTRLNINFSENSFRFGFSFQDIRVWGEVPQLNRTDINSSVHEAWGELKLSEKSMLKFGRQELVYDDSRIFGNVDWAQQGRSHDVAVYKYLNESGLQFHLGLAYNQTGERNAGTSYTLAGSYKTMQYAWLSRKSEDSQFSILFLNNGLESDSGNHYFSQTFGGRYQQAFSTSSGMEGSAYIQTGKLVTSRKLGAWYSALSGYFRPSDKVRIDMGFEILSGTDQREGTAEKSKSFTPLYGTNHKFNGHMDYFYVGNHNNNVGLVDIFSSFEYSKNRFSIGVTPHVFFSHAGIINPDIPAEDMPKFLGVELDLYGGYKINEFSQFRFGYSKMFASETMEVLKGGSRKEANHWAWLMVVIKPVLIKSVNQ
jgi:hypothetical protein